MKYLEQINKIKAEKIECQENCIRLEKEVEEKDLTIDERNKSIEEYMEKLERSQLVFDSQKEHIEEQKQIINEYNKKAQEDKESIEDQRLMGTMLREDFNKAINIIKVEKTVNTKKVSPMKLKPF